MVEVSGGKRKRVGVETVNLRGAPYIFAHRMGAVLDLMTVVDNFLETNARDNARVGTKQKRDVEVGSQIRRFYINTVMGAISTSSLTPTVEIMAESLAIHLHSKFPDPEKAVSVAEFLGRGLFFATPTGEEVLKMAAKMDKDKYEDLVWPFIDRFIRVADKDYTDKFGHQSFTGFLSEPPREEIKKLKNPIKRTIFKRDIINKLIDHLKALDTKKTPLK